MHSVICSGLGSLERFVIIKCTKFGQLILRKIIKIVATRCQILRLKCFFLLPIKLLPLLNLLICTAWSVFAPSCYSLLICYHPFSTTYIFSLRITNRSFRYASPHLWNQLPVSFRQPCTKHPADDVTLSHSPPTYSPLSPSITHSLFHSRLKTHLFHKSFPP